MASLTVPLRLKLLRLFYAYASWVSPGLAVRLLWQQLLAPPRQSLSETHRAFLASAQPVALAHVTVPEGQLLALRGYRWENGPRTVMLVHGWGGNSAVFSRLAPVLVAAGFTVVALDLPAHGASAGKESTLLDAREALREWVAQWGWPYAVVAHSLGGVAAALLLENAAGQVEKFVFVGTPVRGASAFEFSFDYLAVPCRIRQRFYEHLMQRVGQPVDYFALAHRKYLQANRVLAVYDTADEVVDLNEVRTYLAAYADIEQYWVHGVGHYRLFRSEAVQQRIKQFLAPEPSATGVRSAAAQQLGASNVSGRL